VNQTVGIKPLDEHAYLVLFHLTLFFQLHRSQTYIQCWWMMNRKGCESGYGSLWGHVPEYAWRNWEKPESLR